MKFGQRFSKNTFKSFLAALILTAGVVGAASTALAAGELVTEEQNENHQRVAAADRRYGISYW